MSDKKIYLKYTGAGAAIIGVPARDLTKDEADVAKTLGHDLLASGLYELVEEEKDTQYSVNDADKPFLEQEEIHLPDGNVIRSKSSAKNRGK